MNTSALALRNVGRFFLWEGATCIIPTGNHCPGHVKASVENTDIFRGHCRDIDGPDLCDRSH